MKKREMSILLVTMVSAALMPAPSVWAETDLPYVGPRMTDCQVVQPESESTSGKIDAGYIASESCKFIYIKPPQLGRMNFNSILNTKTQQCIQYKRSLEFIDNDEKVLLAQYRGQPQKMLEIITAYQKMRDELEEIGGATDIAASWITGTIDLGWSRLVEAYQKINPNTQVRPLPISLGLLNTFTVSLNDQMSRIMTSGAQDIVVMREADGFELPENITEDPAFPFPKLISKLSFENKNKPILMGQAMNMNLMLNFKGTCALYDKSGNLEQNPANFLGGTYTYFYPIQSSAVLNVRFSKSKLINDITSFIDKNRRPISVDDIAPIVKNSKSLVVEINEGAFPGNVSGLTKIEEFKDEVLNYAINNILAEAGQKISIAVDSSKYLEERRATTRRCQKFLFWKSCHTHSYTVVVENVDWDLVIQKVSATFQNIENNSGVADYRSYFMMDTSAFEPVVKK
jgi:hypothetical protein